MSHNRISGREKKACGTKSKIGGEKCQMVLEVEDLEEGEDGDSASGEVPLPGPLLV